MKILSLLLRAATTALLCLIALAAAAADYPAPKEGDWTARDFRFHTGEVMPELRLHYTTVGAPSGQPVLILHGTTGSGAAMLSPAFAGEGVTPCWGSAGSGSIIGSGAQGKGSPGIEARESLRLFWSNSWSFMAQPRVTLATWTQSHFR